LKGCLPAVVHRDDVIGVQFYVQVGRRTTPTGQTSKTIPHKYFELQARAYFPAIRFTPDDPDRAGFVQKRITFRRSVCSFGVGPIHERL
jgi:hypothetical protein